MKKILIIITSALLFQSCATMLTGTTEMAKFNSNPPGAKIIVNGREVGTTNSDVSIDRGWAGKKNPLVRLEKEGYEPVEFYYERKTNPAYWLNIFNLFIFSVNDFASGAVYKGKYKEYTKQLEPIK